MTERCTTEQPEAVPPAASRYARVDAERAVTEPIASGDR